MTDISPTFHRHMTDTPAQPDSPLALVRRQILAVSPDADAETLAELLNRVEALSAFAREMKRHVEGVLLERVLATGPILIGHRRFYEGRERKTTCPDVPAAVAALWDASGGDVATFAACLGAGALLPGRCRAALGDEAFDKHFTTAEVPELREGVERRKKLMSVDTRYVKEIT